LAHELAAAASSAAACGGCVKLRHDLPDRCQRRSKSDAGSRGPLFKGHFVTALLSMTLNIQVGALQKATQREIVMQISLRSDQ
jgi:hypothetical protein